MEVVQGVAVVVSEAGALETAEAISASLDGAALSITTSLEGAAASAKLSAEQMVAAMSSASAKMAAAQVEGANVGASARIVASQKALDIEVRARGIATAQAEVAAAKLAVIQDASAANTALYSDKLIALAQEEAAAKIALGDTVAYRVAINSAKAIGLAEEETSRKIALAEKEAEAKVLLAEKVALAQIKATEKAEAAELRRIERETEERAREAAMAAGINPILVNSAKSAAPVLIAAGAAIGMIELAKTAIETAASLEHLSHRTGISVRDLSILNVAAKEAGMDIGALGQAFNKLDVNVDKALHGSTEQIVNFKEVLKIKSTPELFTWLNDTTPIEKLKQLATALEAIPNAEERIAKAKELMGGRGGDGGSANLLFFLHQLAGDGFSKVTAEASKLGVVIDEQTGNSALRFEQEWARVKLEMMGVGLVIAQTVLPVLHQLMNESAPKGGILDYLTSLAGILKLIVTTATASFSVLSMLSGVSLVKASIGFVKRDLDPNNHDNLKANAGKWWTDTVAPVTGFNKTASEIWGGGAKPADETSFERMMGHDSSGGKDPTREQALLTVAQDQLAVARALNAEAHASDALDNLRLGHAVKLLEIQQQLDSQKHGISKDLDQGMQAKLTAEYEATAAEKRSAEAENYNRARASMLRTDAAHLASLDAELAIQRMQVTAAGTYDSINQAQIEHEIRLASLRKDGAAALAAIDPHADNYRKLRDDAQESTRNQVAAENAAFQLAQERQQYADDQRLAAMRLQTNEARRGVDIAQRTADLTELQRTKVMTLTDINRKADLERKNALDEFEAKVQRERASNSSAIRDLAMGTDYLDPDSLTRFANQAVEINTRTTAVLIAARIAYQSQVSQIDATAEQGRSTSRQAFNYSQQAQDLADYQKFADAISPILGAPLGAIVAHFRKALDEEADRAKQIHNRAAQDISGSVSDIFGAATGARSWNDAFSSIAERFQSSMSEAINVVVKHWTDQLARTANGMPELAFGADGQAYPLFPTKAQQSRAQNTLRGVQIAGAALGVGMQGYGAGVSGASGARTQSVIGGAVSGAATGMELFSAAGPIAGIYGAIIGAAVSAIASAIGASQRQADYKYGTPVFDNGTARLANAKNITQAQQDQMTAQMQTTFSDTWNAWTKIMLKLPSAESPTMPKHLIDPFQDNPSAHWAEHFSEYLSATLPKEIAGMFKTGMESSFVRSGMTSAAFNAFWAEADTMDPTKRAQFWSDMADGLASFDRAAQNMKAVGASSGSSSPARFDSLGNLMSEGESQFVADTKVAATQLYGIARQMVNMTGPDKAAAFKALGAGVESLTKSLQDFLARIGQIKVALKQTFDDARLEMGLSRLDEQTDAQGNVISPQDKNAQAKLLQDRADQNLYQINNAAKLGLTPDRVQQLTDETIGILQRIYALDPSKEAYDWWLKQMEKLELASTLALHDLGDQAKTAVEKILVTLQPFEDWFLGLPVELDPAWSALDTSIFGAVDALNDLQRAIRNVTANPGTGTGPGGGVDKNPGGVGDPKPGLDPVANSTAQPANITINVNNAIGIDDFKRQMTQAAAEAFRHDPGMLERPYS